MSKRFITADGVELKKGDTFYDASKISLPARVFAGCWAYGEGRQFRCEREHNRTPFGVRVADAFSSKATALEARIAARQHYVERMEKSLAKVKAEIVKLQKRLTSEPG